MTQHQVFQRLIGLETEYAVREPGVPSADRSSRYRLFERLVATLQSRLPSVAARHFKEGRFLANGGAVWFEAERPSAGGGLIEGTTPECRGPRQLLVYQRALDRLLAETAEQRGLRLLKNDRDALDHVYGAQENYETTVAQGGWLWLWRLGLVALFPLAVLTWLVIGLCVLSTITYFLAAGLFYCLATQFAWASDGMARALFGPDVVEGRTKVVHVPPWLEDVLLMLTRLVTLPLAGAMYVLAWWTVFRRERRLLTSFLLSRAVVCGAGTLNREGQFELADKAGAINCLLGYGGLLQDRPLYCIGHFFKAAYAESWFSPAEYWDLLARRQRLQIALGDSNMCETAEFLRVGSTALVLDAIEAGCFADAPRFRQAIRGLHALSADASLQATILDTRGRRWSALDLQHYYLQGCRHYLAEVEHAPGEAWEVVELWERMLKGLHEWRDHRELPRYLLGSLDWVTKSYLLEQAGDGGSWAERKKIDLRYHELGLDGYFAILQQAAIAPRLTDDAAIERAIRIPPQNSPATMRGHFIREFHQGEQPITVNWKRVMIGTRWNGRVIHLSRYAHDGRSGSPRKPSSRPA